VLKQEEFTVENRLEHETRGDGLSAPDKFPVTVPGADKEGQTVHGSIRIGFRLRVHDRDENETER